MNQSCYASPSASLQGLQVLVGEKLLAGVGLGMAAKTF